MFTTRDGGAPLAPPAQGTDARAGGRWLGGGKALPWPGGMATLRGGADAAGLRGPEQSRRILAFQALKEQLPVPMDLQDLSKPLLGGGHALFCTFSFGSSIVGG